MCVIALSCFLYVFLLVGHYIEPTTWAISWAIANLLIGCGLVVSLILAHRSHAKYTQRGLGMLQNTLVVAASLVSLHDIVTHIWIWVLMS